ncbi:MAG: Ppx/GppA phosphatase family protein [Planctomycetota bacterium]
MEETTPTHSPPFRTPGRAAAQAFPGPAGDTPRPSAAGRPPLRPVAVIDIGVSSIRMAIAELGGDRSVRMLDTLIQAVDLGRDVFDTRKLRRSSIERAAEVLSEYRQIALQYGVRIADDVRVVATTAVREASNALAFTDRIFVATGLVVESIDEAEVNRMTYSAVLPHLREHPKLADGKNVVVEVGGGTTEMIVIRSGNILHSESYRLGSLRSLRKLERYRSGSAKRRAMLRSQITKTLMPMIDTIRRDTAIELVALGGDVRFAARQLLDNWDGHSLAKVSAKKLSRFSQRVLTLDTDGIAKRYGASFLEAETLGPALLVYQMLAEEFSLSHIYVCDTNLRVGLLQDLSRRGSWTPDFRNQIVRSALQLGRRFGFDESHARNVAELSRRLFEELTDLHELDSRHEVLLFVAALLHEIGMSVNIRSNHKHALYLIRNSDVFGLSREDLLLVGLVARYHRRAYPQPSHEGFATLPLSQRVLVAKLASILRLAIALDDRRTGRIRDLRCQSQDGRLTILVSGIDDVSLEQVAMGENSGLFRDVFGMSVSLNNPSEH